MDIATAISVVGLLAVLTMGTAAARSPVSALGLGLSILFAMLGDPFIGLTGTRLTWIVFAMQGLVLVAVGGVQWRT